MLGLLESWLFTQLGVNCSLTRIEDSNIFQDGCVLVNILQKYGLLDGNFIGMILPSVEARQCMKNLRLLKPVFNMLKVKYDETIINGILENRSGTIINLLYEVYICLENKQHLYFIQQQNFERVSRDITNNLDSVAVKKSVNDEQNIITTNVCLEQPLVTNKDIIKWYKNKYEKVKNHIDGKIGINNLKKNLPNKELSNVKPTCKTCLSKYRTSNNSDSYDDLPELSLFLKSSGDEKLLSYEEFISRYKLKQHTKAERNCLQKTIQHELLNRTWSKIEEKQNEVYNLVLSDVLLKQSQYEKQILSKLIHAQQETHVQRENKTWAKKSIINEQEDKIVRDLVDLELHQKFEMLEKIHSDEQKRVLELHKKLYKEKKEIVKKENYNFCKDIVDCLLDIATFAAEYKSKHGVEVSKGLWDNWMKLFIKSQPVRIQLQSLDNDIAAGADIDYDGAISFEKEQDEILNENDVDDYLLTSGRWFYSNVCLEHADLSERNLAFIVYRLLSIKYPPPPSSPAADIPPLGVAGILLNFHSVESTGNLKLLLNKSRIHIFDTETAIKKCITQFQIETSPPPEEKGKGKKGHTKNGTVNKSKQQGGKEKKEPKRKESKKSQKKKSNKNEMLDQTSHLTEEEKIISVVDKETQTSVVVETEEKEIKQRTAIGIIGENVSNILKEGLKLDDSLLVSVIVEYLKSLEECDGWILLNYPVTIDQARHLELALTGKEIPMGKYAIQESKPLQDERLDQWSEKRKSRLLNCPLSEMETQSFKSYFNIFIQVEDDDREIVSTENNIPDETDKVSYSMKSQELKEEVNTLPDFIKEFYTNQAIYKEFYCKSFEINALKSLARIILKEDGIEAKPSIDVFGEETLNKLTKSKKTDKKGKLSLGSKKPKQKEETMNKSKFNEKSTSEMISENQENYVTDDNEKKTIPYEIDSEENRGEKTGHPEGKNDTNLISLPLNNEFGDLLATTWENIESCYINNLKEILFENRFINLRLHPYCIHVEKEMKTVIDKHDLRQSLINIFQEYYNNISNELRALSEMKNQLHCRVLELQQNLWEIADERKKEIEAKREEIIYENWLANEITMLINNYLSLVQTEFDRSLETLKLINDYYLNMFERTPPVPVIHPESLDVSRLNVDTLLRTVKKMSDVASEMEEENYDIERKENNVLAHSLVCCSNDQKPIYLINSIIFERIKNVKLNFNTVSQIFHTQNKNESEFLSNVNKQGLKEKSAPSKKATPVKLKKGDLQQETLIPSPPNSEKREGKVSLDNETLIEQWKSIINTETERFNFRLDLIYERAKENVMEFYCFLETEFCNLHKNTLSSYNTNISNINAICNYLKTAIEEESPLRHPLILGQDKFVVSVTDTMESHGDSILRELREDIDECKFTVNQLHFLIDIFKISGPQGVIRKQPLCYILQDLMLLDTYDNQPYLPKIWYTMSELQLREAIDNIFGLEFSIDWRDFIIYSLDIPYPEVSDILHLRKQFLKFDLEETELISLEDYENITLWFENELPRSPKQGLRFALVKKLLPEIFKVDSLHVNYTALLLSFCKDFNPANGLRKALSLSLGKNVITSKSELDMILQDEKETNEIVYSLLLDIINGIATARETAQVYDIIESLSNLELPQISSEDSWKSSLLASWTSGSNKSRTLSQLPNPPPTRVQQSEAKSIVSNISTNNQKLWVSKIPVSSVLNVLSASFFYQDRRSTFKNQYLYCLEDEADSEGMIEAYDLVNLSCIQKLFTMTNKFKISIPCDVLRECLDNEYKTLDSSEKRCSTMAQMW